MALLTRRAMTRILSEIMDTGGMTEDMEKNFERIRDDFDEREGILREYGDVYDGEDKEEYDFEKRDVGTTEFNPDETRLEVEEWKAKYDEMKDRYLRRFWEGSDNEYVDDVGFDEVMERHEEDAKFDQRPHTFDELLYSTEG